MRKQIFDWKNDKTRLKVVSSETTIDNAVIKSFDDIGIVILSYEKGIYKLSIIPWSNVYCITQYNVPNNSGDEETITLESFMKSEEYKTTNNN